MEAFPLIWNKLEMQKTHCSPWHSTTWFVLTWKPLERRWQVWVLVKSSLKQGLLILVLFLECCLGNAMRGHCFVTQLSWNILSSFGWLSLSRHSAENMTAILQEDLSEKLSAFRAHLTKEAQPQKMDQCPGWQTNFRSSLKLSPNVNMTNPMTELAQVNLHHPTSTNYEAHQRWIRTTHECSFYLDVACMDVLQTWQTRHSSMHRTTRPSEVKKKVKRMCKQQFMLHVTWSVIL